MAVSHFKKHVKYLKSTAVILNDSISANQHLLDSRTENMKAQELLCELKSLEDSVLQLQQCVIHLRHKVRSVSYTHVLSCITQYRSTVYIGMALVLASIIVYLRFVVYGTSNKLNLYMCSKGTSG